MNGVCFWTVAVVKNMHDATAVLDVKRKIWCQVFSWFSSLAWYPWKLFMPWPSLMWSWVTTALTGFAKKSYEELQEGHRFETSRVSALMLSTSNWLTLGVLVLSSHHALRNERSSKLKPKSSMEQQCDRKSEIQCDFHCAFHSDLKLCCQFVKFSRIEVLGQLLDECFNHSVGYKTHTRIIVRKDVCCSSLTTKSFAARQLMIKKQEWQQTQRMHFFKTLL